MNIEKENQIEKVQETQSKNLESGVASGFSSVANTMREYISHKIQEMKHSFTMLGQDNFSSANNPHSYEIRLNEIQEKYKDIIEREVFFEENPSKELTFLKQQTFISQPEIENRLNSFLENGDDVTELMNSVIDRISTETSYFDSMDETIGKQNIKENQPAKNSPVPIKYGNKDIPIKGAGMYTGTSIILESDTPTPVSILQELATDGKISSFDVVHHELIHLFDKHENMKEKDISIKEYLGTGAIITTALIVGIVRRGDMSGVEAIITSAIALSPVARLLIQSRGKENNAEILTEAHAYISGKKAHNEINTNELAGHLSKNYGVTSKDNIEKVYLASNYIQCLHALGMKEKDIGEIIHLAVWDNKTKSWPIIDQAINTHMANNNITKEELDEFIKDQNLRYAVDKLKVKKITQEEIIKFDKKSDKK